MTTNDDYIVKTVLEDLLFLQESWDQTIDDASLRRSSNVLRMLLANGNYGRAWRLVGFEKEPEILVPSLEKVLAGIPINNVQYAQAGGAICNGMKISSTLRVNFAMSEEQIKERGRRGAEADLDTYGLTKFLESPCIVIGGEMIKRRELVLYVANRLGGAHLDVSRDNRKDIERKFWLLDSLNKEVMLANKSSIYFELLSIGQSVVNSRDTAKFIEKARGVDQ